MEDEARAEAAPASPEEAAPKPGRRRLLRVLAAGGSLLLALVVAEGVTRLVRPQRLGVATQESFEGLNVPRAGVSGRDLAPGEFDTTITINPQRFRGARPTAERPAAGTLRVAVLGDSFAFGEGAEDGEAYPAQLEAILRAQGRAVEVLNAGSRGTGTGEQALFYAAWVARFAPRRVILTAYANDLGDDRARGLFVLEDGAAVPRPREERARADAQQGRLRRWTRALPGYDALSQSSHLLALLRRLSSQRLQAQRAAAFEAPAQPAPEAGAALLAAELSWLQAQVAERGARLAVVFVPAREQVSAVEGAWAEQVRADAGVIVEALRARCAALDAPFLDLTAALTRRAGDGATLYHARDGHCTPAGYRAVAEEVARGLTRARFWRD